MSCEGRFPRVSNEMLSYVNSKYTKNCRDRKKPRCQCKCSSESQVKGFESLNNLLIFMSLGALRILRLMP